MKYIYVLDASAFINGFKFQDSLNFTISEVSEEVRDFKSKLIFQQAIDDNILFIKEPSSAAMEQVNDVILDSGDSLRLSIPAKKLIALAVDFSSESNVMVITDDYSIQNVFKILGIPYKSVLTEGIKEIYNWKKVCKGCRKEYSDRYCDDVCEICGSKIFKKRIKLKIM
jgi:UPF0271 protein